MDMLRIIVVIIVAIIVMVMAGVGLITGIVMGAVGRDRDRGKMGVQARIMRDTRLLMDSVGMCLIWPGQLMVMTGALMIKNYMMRMLDNQTPQFVYLDVINSL